MAYSTDVFRMLPKIVNPHEYALAILDSNLQRMIQVRCTTGQVSVEELDYYIEYLGKYTVSLEDLKYSIFEQADNDTDSAIEAAKKVIKPLGLPETAVTDMEKKKLEDVEIIVKKVKEGFDTRIKRAGALLLAAKSFRASIK